VRAESPIPRFNSNIPPGTKFPGTVIDTAKSRPIFRSSTSLQTAPRRITIKIQLLTIAVTRT
jgi:hypothetical protein